MPIKRYGGSSAEKLSLGRHRIEVNTNPQRLEPGPLPVGPGRRDPRFPHRPGRGGWFGTLPPGLHAVLNCAPGDLDKEPRLAAAILWYQQGRISQEWAAKIAGVDRTGQRFEVPAHLRDRGGISSQASRLG